MTIYVPLAHSRRTASGRISDAYRAGSSFGFSRSRHTYAQKLGLRYQAKIEIRLLADLAEYKVEIQPHFRFVMNGSPQSAFPDALIHCGDDLCIVEIKLRHTYDGWSQLTRLYLPVVQQVYPVTRIRRLEICKSFDPSVTLPEPVDLVTDLPNWLMSKSSNYGVLIWGR